MIGLWCHAQNMFQMILPYVTKTFQNILVFQISNKGLVTDGRIIQNLFWAWQHAYHSFYHGDGAHMGLEMDSREVQPSDQSLQ